MNNGISFENYFYSLGSPASASALPKFQFYYVDFRDSASMHSTYKSVQLNGESVFANVEIVNGGDYVISEDTVYEYSNFMQELI